MSKSEKIDSALLKPAQVSDHVLPRGRDLEEIDSPSNHSSKRRKIQDQKESGHDDLVSDNFSNDKSHSAWQTTINDAVKAIVSVSFSQVTAFDTDGAAVSEATGFIVDAERGIILTNRHVACAGPFVGEAVCHNHEEIDVHTIYRDPIHDFGFLKFDPKKIKYMPVQQVELRPDLAKVGLDIRVVGNDAGEKLSILAGSISRLDRNTPDYGELTYNDFNTFYLQAASSTSGGSSGSPVIDINGNAVALQAGGSERAATDFFLPLDRVKRALEFIQREEQVPRGDIQTTFRYRPFDEARRLGLSAKSESKLRKLFPEEIGVLVVDAVLPEGPAYKMLEEGDILLTMNDLYVTKFVPFENTLDSNVGKSISVAIERGGKILEFDVQVGNLHDVTPDRYVEYGGAILHTLSYQLASHYCVPCRGVYVADPAGVFRLDGDDGWIVKAVDDKETPDIDTFIEVMKGIPDYSRVSCVYYSIADVHTILGSIIHIDRHWSSFRLAVRNDISGLWDFTDLGEPLPPLPPVPITKKIIELDDCIGPSKSLIRCLVKIHFRAPCRLDGFPYNNRHGSGVIVDKEKGFVVVGRGIVPNALGDITITIADSIVIPAHVLFLHPSHNYSIIQYDPKALGDTNVMSACFSEKKIAQGHSVTLVAYNHNRRPVFVRTIATEISCDTIPPNGTPRYRAMNMELITLETPLASFCPAGVLADEEGKLQGLWLNFLGDNVNGRESEYSLGVHIAILEPILKRLRQGEGNIVLRSLKTEFMVPSMASLYSMGLSNDWIKKVEEANPNKHQLFMVRGTEANSESAKVLKELDVLLAINGKVATRMCDIDVQYEADELDLTVLREKKEMTIKVKTNRVSGNGTNRVVFWAGAAIQEPHQAVLQQSKTTPSQIYVTSTHNGSPACMYGLEATMWITHIRDQKVTTLDDLIEQVKDIPDSTYVRVRCIDFDNVPAMLSLKMMNHYFPLADLTRNPEAACGWSKKVIR
ncbi:trypsin-like cysteine/serine peptidase domain-containing protein [Sporodiniella umbellata]|nr:trypsin-like cysteine/serine peptidase domain-containing protein [Sporodiniella umbellata]